jgi:hypothetical protein
MADYSKSKSYGTKALPADAKEVSNLNQRIEPVITPELLLSRYLHGIDMTSYNSDELKDQIVVAIQEMEIMTGLHIDKV